MTKEEFDVIVRKVSVIIGFPPCEMTFENMNALHEGCNFVSFGVMVKEGHYRISVNIYMKEEGENNE